MLRYTFAIGCVMIATVAAECPDNANVSRFVDLDQLTFDQLDMWTTQGIKIERGQTVRLATHGNPTTGYTWHHETMEGVEKPWEVEICYVQDVDEWCQDCYGIGGTYYFYITGGDSMAFDLLELCNYRDWELEDKCHFGSYIFPVHVM